jgi:hypothetical protein
MLIRKGQVEKIAGRVECGLLTNNAPEEAQGLERM